MRSLNDLKVALNSLDDGRRTDCGNFKYSTASIVGCTFCAVMAGYQGARAYADFIEDNYIILNLYFDLPGIPSHDTINRVLASVDPHDLSNVFRTWSGISLLAPENIQVDGKTIRASRMGGEQAAHIVTVYAEDYSACLLEEMVNGKGNEISAFEQILAAHKDSGFFEGKIVTADAMFCQKKFCTMITEAGGNWIFVLKENHPNLYADAKLYWSEKASTATKVIPIRGHGRKGTRTVRFTNDVSWILENHEFTGLQCMAEVTTVVTEKGKTTTSTMYLLGSVDTLEELVSARSKHWGIESMHWILDTAFEEDHCTCRNGNYALNLNIFRKMAIYFFGLAKKIKKYSDHSTKRLMGRCKANFSHLRTILCEA